MSLASRANPAHIYRGYWVASAAFFSFAVAIGSAQYGFSFFVEPLEAEFGWTRTQINTSLSFTAVGSLVAPFLGRIMDKHGAKRIMAISLSLVGISFFVRPFMTELWHWYAISFIQFAGFTGATMLPAGRLVGIWFNRTRGRVMGFTLMGNNFGGLVMPPIIGAALVLGSWQGAYIVIGIITLLIVIYGLVMVKEYPSAREVSREQPDEILEETSDGKFVLTGWTVREALHDKAFYAITVAVMLGTFTYAAILPQVSVHLTTEGVSVTTASFILAAYAVAGMLGKLTLGILAERITVRYTLMIDLFGQAGMLAILALATTPGLMLVVAPIFGYFMGGFGALSQTIIQNTFGIRYFGSIMGLINVTTAVSFVVGPRLAGESFDRTGSYTPAFLFVAVLFAIGGLALIFATTSKKVAVPQSV